MTRTPTDASTARTHSKNTTTTRRAALLAMAAVVLVATGALTAASAAGDDDHQVAIVAGGCFWGMEHLLRDLDGVIDTDVGYTADRNDKKSKPAETVRMLFDPERITYEEILRFYFRIHDPTTMNRQGNDMGAKYRSAIFVLDDEQRQIAEQVRTEVDASGFWKKPVVTLISDAGPFEEAPEGHQDYLVKNPGGYTCHYERGE